MLYSSGELYLPVLLFSGVRSLGQEIPLHLELPNLLVELGNEGLVLLFLLTALTTKDARSTLQQSPLPCANLARMKLVATGYLCRGLFFSQRFQGYLGLEGRAALPLSFRDLLPLPDKNRCPWFIEKDSHLATCRISWVHFRPLSIRIIGTLHSEQILARYGNIGVEDYKEFQKETPKSYSRPTGGNHADNRLRAELYRDQDAVLLEDARVCATLNQMAIGNSDAYFSGLIGTFGTET